MKTGWGDSVHCRTRNIAKRDTVLIFPSIPDIPTYAACVEVIAEVFPSPGAVLSTNPTLHYRVNDSGGSAIGMVLRGERTYSAVIPAQNQGDKVSFYIEAEDSRGIRKTAPMLAPDMSITYEVK